MLPSLANFAATFYALAMQTVGSSGSTFSCAVDAVSATVATIAVLASPTPTPSIAANVPVSPVVSSSSLSTAALAAISVTSVLLIFARVVALHFYLRLHKKLAGAPTARGSPQGSKAGSLDSPIKTRVNPMLAASASGGGGDSTVSPTALLSPKSFRGIVVNDAKSVMPSSPAAADAEAPVEVVGVHKDIHELWSVGPSKARRNF